MQTNEVHEEIHKEPVTSVAVKWPFQLAALPCHLLASMFSIIYTPDPCHFINLMHALSMAENFLHLEHGQHFGDLPYH